jgi:hypothetical protein
MLHQLPAANRLGRHRRDDSSALGGCRGVLVDLVGAIDRRRGRALQHRERELTVDSWRCQWARVHRRCGRRGLRIALALPLLVDAPHRRIAEPLLLRLGCARYASIGICPAANIAHHAARCAGVTLLSLPCFANSNAPRPSVSSFRRSWRKYSSVIPNAAASWPRCSTPVFANVTARMLRRPRSGSRSSNSPISVPPMNTLAVVPRTITHPSPEKRRISYGGGDSCNGNARASIVPRTSATGPKFPSRSNSSLVP